MRVFGAAQAVAGLVFHVQLLRVSQVGEPPVGAAFLKAGIAQIVTVFQREETADFHPPGRAAYRVSARAFFAQRVQASFVYVPDDGHIFP